MGLNAPKPGLKRLRHNANSPKRVELIVPAGDELEVSAEVAAQLQAADQHFQPAEPAGADEPAEQAPVRRTATRGRQ